MIKNIALILVLLLLTNNIKGQQMDLRIIPKPQNIEVLDKEFQFNSNFKIYSEVNNENFSTALEYLKKSLFNSRDIWAELSDYEDESTVIIKITDDLNEEIPEGKIDEAYQISVSEKKINISASTEKGLFYGIMSIIQVIDNQEIIPQFSLTDWPDLSVRGISDDISRGQVSTLENFKKIIRNIARYKMNVYMPYMEDVLQLESFPTIGVNRGALSREEVTELVDYASKHYIEVIPIFQTLGHFENILLQDDFLHYADFPGAASLDVTNENTYLFIETMLKEVFEMFPSEYFHMGADESFDVGKGNSKELTKKTSLAKVHAQHYKRVYDICKKYGKKVMMYGDIILHHSEILEELPKDIIVIDWYYRGRLKYKSTKTFKEAGQEYYVSPSVWNFLTTFPTNSNAMPNVKYFIEDGLRNSTTGMINSNWGDYGSETIKELVYYGYAWSAQCAWSYEKSDLSAFTKDYMNDFFGTENSAAIRIYKDFADPLNQMLWHDVFRHPVLPLRDPVWWESRYGSDAIKASWMELSIPQIEEDLRILEKEATRNKDHIEILKFTAELSKWYKLKLETNFILQDKLDTLDIDLEECLRKIDSCISGLNELEDKYKSIWNSYYKSDNLHMIIDKFDRLEAYFEETAAKLREDRLESPAIKSKWICYSATKKKNVNDVVFKKEFEINDDVKEAHLQLLADTYAELSINGELIDTIYARRSLSLLVDYGRILFVDISKHLQKGKNIIEVKAKNFERKGIASINCISEIITENNKIEIISDDSWKVKKVKGSWKKAKTKEYKSIVTEPNFETKRSSWIERY